MIDWDSLQIDFPGFRSSPTITLIYRTRDENQRTEIVEDMIQLCDQLDTLLEEEGGKDFTFVQKTLLQWLNSILLQLVSLLAYMLQRLPECNQDAEKKLEKRQLERLLLSLARLSEQKDL